jgi:hypothetical protein
MLRGDNRRRANSMGNVDMTTFGTKSLLSPAPALYGPTGRSLSLSPLVNPNAIWNNGHHPAPHQHHQYHHMRNHSGPNVSVALMNGLGELPPVPQLNGRIDPATLAARSLRRPSFGTESKKSEESAIQGERIRARNLEKEEIKMDADQLRAVLKQERHRMSRFAGDLAKLKNTSVIYQAEAEMMEEGRINGLMRRVEALQLEKGRIIVELEQEEEMVRYQPKQNGCLKLSLSIETHPSCLPRLCELFPNS